MPGKKIVIKGARVHNLRNVSIEIPRDKLVVITGLFLGLAAMRVLRYTP